MPVYQYRCLSCNNEWDNLKSMVGHFEDQEVCPKCQQLACRIYKNSNIMPKIWDADKEFENLAPKPMKFPTEASFRSYLKAHKQSSGALL